MVSVALDANLHKSSATVLDTIENRPVAERLQTAAGETERAGIAPAAEGEFTLVPNVGARGEPA